ncbi:hypothetical protein [Mycolicibacterium brumae]|uniref:DUF4226 domain-containing protein n=1 Tax=Mycolicibacterium brumae TaxID=85968 RepID=A0A2G5P840_9MYCO|nr:hypothetical protein [Mycolicibacterium brumae]MCV7194113.1 hypothetical protein [Mycolicibacterium brumae]PIB74427.1 hypothetical protein CQY22_013240 [Mycolicibacterium brumae]RWA22714.1 hypothetical protein MBRU_12250 [Mycolicibacterium brumae DSM 44177]UWW07480.1 hypothetical protein L2Z93_000495 [Mycolicibacterium brumae]
MTRPAKSDVYVMDIAPLGALADELDACITTALESSSNVHNTIYNFDWDGAAHDAALIRADRQIAEDHTMLTAMGDLRDAQRDGATTMGPMITTLRTEGQALEADDFTVAEDWTVTDAWHYDAMWSMAQAFGPATVELLKAKQAQRANDAKTATARLQPLADELGAADRKTRAGVVKATEALNLSIGRAPTTASDGKKNGPTIQLVDNETPADGDQPPANPTVNGDGTKPTTETEGVDLDATIPGTGIKIGGDGKSHHPYLNGVLNPLDTDDGTRPIPTGTAVGSDGKQYAFYSQPPYMVPGPDGKLVKNNSFVTPNSAIVDLADPSKIIGHAPVAQASGVYDPATNRMYVVGNPGDGHGRDREMWRSAPIDHNNPNGWASGPWERVPGAVLSGDRENQIIGLKGGGYMLVGAENGGPVTAVAAATPQGLIGQTGGQVVVTNDAAGLIGAYGPTVVTDQFNPATGVDTITLRTSQYALPDAPVNPVTHEQDYDPRTAISTFSVTQPPPPPPAPELTQAPQ